jgi:hypothetical protein
LISFYVFHALALGVHLVHIRGFASNNVSRERDLAELVADAARAPENRTFHARFEEIVEGAWQG